MLLLLLHFLGEGSVLLFAIVALNRSTERQEYPAGESGPWKQGTEARPSIDLIFLHEVGG